jgi:hypothetical protein
MIFVFCIFRVEMKLTIILKALIFLFVVGINCLAALPTRNDYLEIYYRNHRTKSGHGRKKPLLVSHFNTNNSILLNIYFLYL